MRALPSSLALGLVLAAAGAAAMSTRVAGLSELATRADLVVLGTATTRESFWSGGRILTRVRVTAEEVWSGDARPGDSVEVLTLGGEVGGIGQSVAGSVAVSPGERVALMLAGDAKRGFFPLGLWQGVVRVRGAGESARVERAVPDVRVVGELPASLPSTLAELRSAVLEAIRAKR